MESRSSYLTDSLVSCVIVFLDTEAFLVEAVESVFAQTYSNWELILVDDGSHDGSSDIAKQLARRYPAKVRYAHHPRHQNRGISASRNLGLSLAKGRYVACLDSDDVWYPFKLEEQVRILSKNPDLSMVYGLDQYWYSWSVSDPRQDFVHRLGVSSGKTLKPPRLVSALLRNAIAIPTQSNPLILRDRIEQVGGFEEEAPSVYEDQALYLKFWSRFPVMPVERCWTRYRIHPSSVCAKVRNAGDLEKYRRRFLDWATAYISSQQPWHPGIASALWAEKLMLKSDLCAGMISFLRKAKRQLKRPLTAAKASGGRA